MREQYNEGRQTWFRRFVYTPEKLINQVFSYIHIYLTLPCVIILHRTCRGRVPGVTIPPSCSRGSSYRKRYNANFKRTVFRVVYRTKLIIDDSLTQVHQYYYMFTYYRIAVYCSMHYIVENLRTAYCYNSILDRYKLLVFTAFRVQVLFN